MPIKIDWGLIATWAQAISSTVVLFMIYRQIKQANSQLVQNDEQERFRRSWEFIKVYLDSQRENAPQLCALKVPFGVSVAEMPAETFNTCVCYFYHPRVHLFVLLNRLVEHQQVDERLLFGYLEDDFNRFIEIGIRLLGLDEFKKQTAPKIQILLNFWGTRIPAAKTLYAVATFSGATSIATAAASSSPSSSSSSSSVSSQNLMEDRA